MDGELRPGNKGQTDEELETRMDQALILFRYISVRAHQLKPTWSHAAQQGSEMPLAGCSLRCVAVVHSINISRYRLVSASKFSCRLARAVMHDASHASQVMLSWREAQLMSSCITTYMAVAASW